jgi:hypothetical protein
MSEPWPSSEEAYSGEEGAAQQLVAKEISVDADYQDDWKEGSRVPQKSLRVPHTITGPEASKDIIVLRTKSRGLSTQDCLGLLLSAFKQSALWLLQPGFKQAHGQLMLW